MPYEVGILHDRGQGVIAISKLRDVQLDLRVLWDGRLARPDWAGKMPTPREIKGFRKRVAHRVKL